MYVIGRWGYLIPVVWVVAGILYARSIEAFAGIGVLIMTLISGLALLIGIITWRATQKWYWGLASTIVSGILIMALIVISVRA